MVIVGLDEVGRGSWAGPLVAGAVVLAKPIPGLKDSKNLSRLSRENLSQAIYSQALAVSCGWVASGEVDSLGLTKATRLAMLRALKGIKTSYDTIIVDGKLNFLDDNPLAKAIIRADNTVPAVSAASIVAKVARDHWMIDVAAKKFPEYDFEKHVGYGTKLHADNLKKHGVCALHRISYKPIQLLGLATL